MSDEKPKQQTIGPDRHIRAVMMDPPWHRESGGGKIKRGADAHYPLLRPEEIVEVVQYECPQWKRLCDDAHLWLWCTNTTLSKGGGRTGRVSDARYVARNLGFRPVTLFTWVKANPSKLMDGEGLTGEGDLTCQDLMEVVQKGLGQYSYGSTEHMLFCARGDFMKPDPDDRHPTAFFAPRTEHSRKPEKSYEIVEDVSPGDYLEVFARREREGWDVWGDEIERFGSDEG